MLAATHLLAGAAIGLAVGRPLPLTLAAMTSHAVLDGVGHDDQTIGVRGQAALAGTAVLALGVAWGPTSPVVLGGLAGAVPDVEIAADLLAFGGRLARYAFPSHWQVRGRAKQHPYRFPGPGVPVGVEVAVTLIGLAALCALGVARGRG